MQYTPRTEDECRRVIPAGEYDFEVIVGEDTRSEKTGRDMIKLRLQIYKGEQRMGGLFDYLMDGEKTAYKLRHAAYACGLGDAYENGRLVGPMFEGCLGRCKVVIQKSKDPAFPADKNSIADYIVPKAGESKTPSRNAPADSGPPTDDLPF